MSGTGSNAPLGNTAPAGPSNAASARTRRGRPAKSQQGPPPASLYPKTFEFISTDPLTKQQPDTRAFIRSYVMRGKNTKKRNKLVDAGPDATRQPAEAARQREREDGLGADASQTDRQLTRARDPDEADSKVTTQRFALAFDKYGSTTVVVLSVFFPGPVKAPHDLSLWNFSDLLDYKAMLKLNSFFRVLKESMYPVEWCFMPDSTKTCWFRWLCESEAYLYSVLLTVSIIQDVFRVTQTTNVGHTSGRLPAELLSPRSQAYMRTTIARLQERLANPETANDDITVAIILALANIADVVGDPEVCKSHVMGLRKMVHMRGGIKGFDNTQLISKISRIDLGWALKYGVKPDFADPEMSWDPHLDDTILLESPVPPESMSASIRDYVQTLTYKLRNVFADLQAFASVANKLAVSSRKLRPDLFQEIMLSIQYRLMLLEYDLDCQPIEEALRLGLLAFQTSVFIQMKNIRVKYEDLIERLRRAVSRIPENVPLLVDLKLWILLMGAIALFDPDHSWLEENIRRTAKGRSWEEVHTLMRSIMWIDLVHDIPGGQVFDSAHAALGEVDLGLGRSRTHLL